MCPICCRKAGRSSWMVPRIRPERVDIGWRCVHCYEYLSVTFDFAFFLCRNSMFFPFVTSTDLRMDGNMRPTSLRKMASGKKPGWKIGRNGNLFFHTRNLMLRWVQGISFGNAMPRQKLPWVCVASAFGDVPLWLAWNNSAIEPNKILSHLGNNYRKSWQKDAVQVGKWRFTLPVFLHISNLPSGFPTCCGPRCAFPSWWNLAPLWCRFGSSNAGDGSLDGMMNIVVLLEGKYTRYAEMILEAY